VAGFRVDTRTDFAAETAEKDPAKHADGKHYSWNQISAGFEQLHAKLDRTNTVAQTRPPTSKRIENEPAGAAYAQLKTPCSPRTWALAQA